MYSSIAANKRNTLLIMAGFIGLVAAIGWVFTVAMGAGSSTIYWILGGTLLYVVIQYFIASRVAISMMGAKEIQKSDNPRLYRIVENLAITTGMQTPKIYLIDDPAPNAFATGRDPQHAMVGATTGLLEIMDDRELEAVMAHEIGHVQNYDIRVSMIAAGLASAIAILADIAIRMLFFSNNRNGHPAMYIVGFLLIILAPIAAALIQMAVSRQREYLADATSVMTTRDSEGMVRALQKLESYGRPMRRQDTSTAHMFLNNPLKGKSFRSWFSTHPPIETRVKRLQGNADKF